MSSPDPDVTPVRTALISCFDKTGVPELAARARGGRRAHRLDRFDRRVDP